MILRIQNKKIKELYFRKLDSTSSFLKREYQNLDDFTFVRSDFQKEGRGRLGRSWESLEKENLMFSVLIKDKLLISEFKRASLASAVSVCNALKSLGLNSLVKWPNDVYVNNQKIAGILLDSVNNDCLIIGIGININQLAFSIYNATSVYKITGKKYSIRRLRKIFYSSLLDELKKIQVGDFSYLDVIREKNYLENKTITVEIDKEMVKAKALKINDDNSLMVLYDDKIYNIISNEVLMTENN